MNTAVEYEIKNLFSPNNKNKIIIGKNQKLTLADCQLLAARSVNVELSHESIGSMQSSYDYLKLCVDQRLPVYGVNTNFGDQVRYIDPHLKDTSEQYYQSIYTRQTDIVKSLSCSLGDITFPEAIKVTMMLRAHCLSQGYSGVSPQLIEKILAFLNGGILPIVRHYGSIGASGDLIPLSSIAAALIGENVDVIYQGKIIKAPEAIKIAQIEKVILEMRDGLALINGTSFMTALASLALYKLNRLFKQMLFAIGMALESMKVITSAYQPLVHQLKNQKGAIEVNDFLVNFWQGSQLVSNLTDLRNQIIQTDTSEKHLQDFYSLRSVPQGFGPFQEAIQSAIPIIESEINSVNDNPIIDADAQQVYHNANFMGFYITDSCDNLKNNIAQASTWLHAILSNMVHPRKSCGLPTNLAYDPNKNNGFRSFQLLAAALAIQNRKLAQSHQSFTLPTEGDNQDVNSLGTHAAFDLQEAVTHLERLTAILFLASTQALEIRGIEKAGQKSQEIYHIIRQYSPSLTHCRPMSEEIMSLIDILEKEIIQ